MSRFRVSAISYLNTAPLMWSFEHGEQREALRERFDVHYTLPAQCARELAEATADIGIIPVAAYATTPDLLVVPDVAIAAKRPVRSILLVSRKSLGAVSSVALDSSSRTSAALLKVLFAQKWHREIHFAEAQPSLERMLQKYDAALLIGDPALRVDRAQFHTWDLAEQWQSWTGKPFVFAFWAVRAAAADENTLAKAAQIFRGSKIEGLRNVEALVAEWSPKLALPAETVRNYLTQNINYELDSANIEGLELFFRYAAEVGALPLASPLRFIRGAPASSPALAHGD
jgi:chorismate dehydratase